MQDTCLQNEPMTSSIAAFIEKKRSHKMLQTNWIITVPWNKGRVEKKTTPYWRLSDVSSAYQ